jgi:hypothetical protein
MQAEVPERFRTGALDRNVVAQELREVADMIASGEFEVLQIDVKQGVETGTNATRTVRMYPELTQITLLVKR